MANERIPNFLQTDPKFLAFLEAAPDAIVVVDGEGVIVSTNRLTESIFGYSHGELIGRSVETLIPPRYHNTHIAQRSSYIRNPVTRPMGVGRPLAGLRKDGREFPVEVSLSPLKTEHGTVVISIIRDISARLQLEAKFQGLLESAPDGIVVVDTDGKMVIVNTQTERMFGYNRDELLGQPVEILVPTVAQDRHVALRNGYIRSPRTRPMGAGRALTGRHKDGTEIHIEISLSPLNTEQGTLVTSIIRDITDRRRAEERIQESLREKEALLKEIHHRVKNNLQVTSSLLRLQSSYIDDPRSRELFAESQNRIRSMALVHEKLYQSKELSRIDFPEYIQTLSSLLFRSFGVDPAQISLRIEGQGLFLSVETAVPCGLMVNELLSNCLKHAFPDRRPGLITVRFAFEDPAVGRYRLEVIDDGVGLPPGLDLDRSESLGLQLVRTLTLQLNGTLEVSRRDPGTAFIIRFSGTKGTEP